MPDIHIQPVPPVILINSEKLHLLLRIELHAVVIALYPLRRHVVQEPVRPCLKEEINAETFLRLGIRRSVPVHVQRKIEIDVVSQHVPRAVEPWICRKLTVKRLSAVSVSIDEYRRIEAAVAA